jgi:hypothetical protein
MSMARSPFAFGDGTVGDHFDPADANPFIAKATANAGRKHPINFAVVNQAVDAYG